MKLLKLSFFCFRLLGKQRTYYRRHSIAAQTKINNSYHFKNGVVPLICTTVGEALDNAADDHGDHTVYISHHQGISKTYLELRNEAEKLASGFVACGLRKGDRVAVFSPNCYEWPLAQLAAAKAGLILVSINYASQSLEVQHCLQKTGCKAVITYEKLRNVDSYSIFNQIIPDLKSSNPMKIKSEKLPNLQSIIMLSKDNKEGVLRFEDVLNMGNKESGIILSEIEKSVQCDDPVNVQFTSGTTGMPKAAVLTHHGLVNTSNAILKRMGFDMKSPTMCCQVPFFHVFGTVVGIFTPMMNKCSVVLPCSTFDSKESLKTIENYRCSTVLGTSTMFIDLFKTHKSLKNDIRSLNQALIGGGSVPESVVRGLKDDFKIQNIHIGYGLTESSAAVSLMGPNTNYNVVLSGYMEPIAGTETKIVDSRNKIVPKLVHGEICVRGYNVFPCYWEDKEKTDEAIDENGWLHSGDVGEMNYEGEIRIVGRIKEIVIRGGENIYVSEIESFLSNHPAISEVHVCGVPDDRLGEELCCWINVKPGKTLTEGDIRNFCQGKLSYYKIPRYSMFVQEFPKTVSGKVKKFEMTRISKEKLNL